MDDFDAHEHVIRLDKWVKKVPPYTQIAEKISETFLSGVFEEASDTFWFRVEPPHESVYLNLFPTHGVTLKKEINRLLNECSCEWKVEEIIIDENAVTKHITLLCLANIITLEELIGRVG
jgi:hypothetical protein